MVVPNQNDDYVDIPGVAPITPQSFSPGSPPNPSAQKTPGQVVTLPEQFIGPEPDNRLAQWQAMDAARTANTVTLPEQQVTGTITPPKAPKPGMPGFVPAPPAGVAIPGAEPGYGPQSFIGTSSLSPRQGLQADATVFADMANYYGKVNNAISEGKHDEAQSHHDFAQQQEQSIAQSTTQWQQALADQQAREKRMDDAISKGRQLSVNPDNYWNKKGTASNILSAISIGLGSFGSGMTHGATGNPALTLVNNAIEHDIQSQKDNIENYWKTVSQQKNLDDNAFNRSLTTQNLQANMRLAGYKVYESDLKSIQSKSESQVVKLGTQKQIDDLQLPMNAARKQLAATEAAQAAASAAQVTKDSETFTKDTLELMKEKGLSPQEAAKAVAQINPARAQRLAVRSALPTELQNEHVAGKEQGYASAFNSTVKQLTDHNIQEYEGKIGHAASEADKAVIRQQSAQVLLKQHPEFGKFQFFKPTVGGDLIDVRPPEVKGEGAQGGTDWRSKEEKAKDKERQAYVEQPVLDNKGQPVVGDDGKPKTQKVMMLAVDKKAAEDYRKWSNTEPVIKQQLSIMKKALVAGDVSAYNSARGGLIEKLPSLYGFERGPSSAQVEHTFKDLIPEWTALPSAREALNGGQQKFILDSLNQAELETNSLVENMRTNTFGPQVGKGLAVSDYGNAPKPSAPVAPSAATGPSTITDSKGNTFGIKEQGGRQWLTNARGEIVSPYNPPKNYDFQKR